MSDQVSDPPIPSIEVVAEECFNYAAWQNAVPLLRELKVVNPTESDISSLKLEFSASPEFVARHTWAVDRVSASSEVCIKNIDLHLDAEFLDRLEEATRGTLTFRLLGGDRELAVYHHDLRVLARDEWGGVAAMGELLPAFVTPNAPALAPLLKSAAASLSKHGHSPALDGYQSGDPNRAFLLAAALWSAVAEKSLTYANPPSSFERVGQKTRRVSAVLSDGLATCLDSTLLFAAGLEAIGLNPVLVLVDGHCFVGVWLVDKSLSKRIVTDSSELRKANFANELVVFETTMITHQPPAMFNDAVAYAVDAISESREHEFVAAIDVARARMSQVCPLATHGERRETTKEAGETGPLPMPASPGIKAPAIDDDPVPQTPAGRIERWQRKLIDLSLRNRLLNFKTNQQTVPVLCPDVSGLEDRLADGGRLRLVSLVDENQVADRDSNLYRDRMQKDVDQEFARAALGRDEVACKLGSSDLDRRLTTLFRRAKNDLAEGGSNTLYLAVGFLRWKQQATATTSYRAPLLLVPVKLSRRSASSPFYLSHHDDDVRFNATLLQLLKKDFDCDLTALESNLPTDDSGVDVPNVLSRVRRAVRDIPGFEVVEEVAIGAFSFSKYLMWKDLSERVEQLEKNRVVRHLVREPDKPFSSGVGSSMPQAMEIDTRYQPSDIVHPLPADSSQLAAVMAASEGHDLVIVGPPGTGKSQTIANLIAQCLSVGKTVLFVAEKTAALDVVHRRLKEHGLGDCCVELHSNKAERKGVLNQLEASWKRRRRPAADDWLGVSERLQVRRDQLNAYVAAIHARYPNGWSVYEAMGVSIREPSGGPVSLSWPRTKQHSRDEFVTLQKCVDDLGMAWSALPNDVSLARVRVNEWSMAWQADFLSVCEELKQTAMAFKASVAEFASVCGLSLGEDLDAKRLSPAYRFASALAAPSLPDTELFLNESLDSLKSKLDSRRELLAERESAERDLDSAVSAFASMLGGQKSSSVSETKRPSLYRLANILVRGELPPDALVFHAEFETLSNKLSERKEWLGRSAEDEQALLARQYDPVLIGKMNLPEFESAWDKARGSFWPVSMLRTKSVAKRLKAYMTQEGTPNPELDLTLFRAKQDSVAALDKNIASLLLPNDLQVIIRDEPSGLESQLTAAAQLRDKILETGASPESMADASGHSLANVRDTAKMLYPPGQRLEKAKAKLRENAGSLELGEQLLAKVMQDASALDVELESAQKLRETCEAFGLTGDDLRRVSEISDESRIRFASKFCQSAKAFTAAWKNYVKLAGEAPASTESTQVASDAHEQATHVLESRNSLKYWAMWSAATTRAKRLGLDAFSQALADGELDVNSMADAFNLAYARWWLPIVVDQSEALRTFGRLQHEEAIREFRRLDELAREAAAPNAKQAIYHNLPNSSDVPRKSELGLLRHQMSLKRPSKSIREVISGMPTSFGKLAPCLLMSPLSIAQYLPADQEPFDVVVFDEASQIPTWDAIGAIARGRQTIIVGDPKQLPPTNFFGKSDDDAENDDVDEFEKDLESILDEAQASGLPTVQLNWHYRSRHESLIAFSNWHYYNNELVTFPSAESKERGVSLSHVADGTYDRGKSRTNRAEADAIVTDLVSRMKRCLQNPEDERLTYGVVTFNSQQQSLIQDLLDEALRSSPELEWFFDDDNRIEPTAVKNLENVQGDERDVMYFSITFGKDAAGKFPVDFGALNRSGGERRLNVAVTRARVALRVYASFLPDELRAERSSSRGVRDLKSFLDYAHRGFKSLVEQNEGSVGGYDSPFEEAVAKSLIALGWEVESQIGVSGFRVDLGIVHPDYPGAYLAGVECDGATYHRSAVARDRDKTRQLVLENLGWNIIRVWSTDWWYEKESATATLHEQLENLLESSRVVVSESNNASAQASEEACGDAVESQTDKVIDPEAASFTNQESFEDAPAIEQPTIAAEATLPMVDGPEGEVRSEFAARHPVNEPELYQPVLLQDSVNRQSEFFDHAYTECIRDMALKVVECEGPIRDDLVAKRIARAHGFARTGAKIKLRVLETVPELTTTRESVGDFLWPDAAVPDSLPFRKAFHSDDRRNLDEIAMPELVGLIQSERQHLESEDPALAYAREMGLARLAKSARERIEMAIEFVIGTGS
ncbi:DUF3320 domain-containing protein [Rosistilla oblonga]|uniref:DUF3320 domain-containing protein n=1 Tax=Rosistilla oblonga TaxID=2527990 RepID=UPI0018D22C22|nr:DUF3320 domain-containing protein [Rosistilla oblonga]